MYSSIVAILYDGRPDERKAMREEYLQQEKFNVVITHYDLIMRDKTYLKKIHWYYVVVDEGHRLKNHESALARTLVSGYYLLLQCLLIVYRLVHFFLVLTFLVCGFQFWLIYYIILL